jgi:hypothetical protein
MPAGESDFVITDARQVADCVVVSVLRPALVDHEEYLLLAESMGLMLRWFSVRRVSALLCWRFAGRSASLEDAVLITRPAFQYDSEHLFRFIVLPASQELVSFLGHYLLFVVLSRQDAYHREQYDQYNQA